eukprot:2338695-Pleurochrysis_carterae.AAC.4
MFSQTVCNMPACRFSGTGSALNTTQLAAHVKPLLAFLPACCQHAAGSLLHSRRCAIVHPLRAQQQQHRADFTSTKDHLDDRCRLCVQTPGRMLIEGLYTGVDFRTHHGSTFWRCLQWLPSGTSAWQLQILHTAACLVFTEGGANGAETGKKPYKLSYKAMRMPYQQNLLTETDLMQYYMKHSGEQTTKHPSSNRRVAQDKCYCILRSFSKGASPNHIHQHWYLLNLLHRGCSCAFDGFKWTVSVTMRVRTLLRRDTTNDNELMMMFDVDRAHRPRIYFDAAVEGLAKIHAQYDDNVT